MSNGKSKAAEAKSGPAPYKVQAATRFADPAPPLATRPPLFRPTDWLAFGLTTLLLLTGYFLTLAPNLTLEDCGELAVGSYYAGIPHPPGYPAWTLYTWLFSHLVPISNVAYRVAMAEALSGAFACGVLALLVSRGSSMMIEGIDVLKDMDRRWENSICVVSGFVSGMVVGFNGYMWSQSVIVEVYSFSMLSMMLMLLCFLRWIYTPDQRRYLYLALFIFGVCVTNHQTLLVAAMGVEIVVIAGQPRLGRDFLLGNSVLFIVGLLAKQAHILTGMDANQPVFVIFCCIGVLSIAGFIWLLIRNPMPLMEFQTFCLLLAAFGLPALGFFNSKIIPIVVVLAAAALVVFLWRSWKYHGWQNGTFVIFGCGVLWLLGASFYFWMPIAGMSDPPMQWGYPRTVEGFWHALSRGQYEKTVPTDLLSSPFHYFYQMGLMFDGIVEEFNWVYSLLAVVPFFFFFKMQRRERAWLTGLFGIYCCMGFFLLLLLNPNGDRQSIEIGRVQFTASHFIVTIFLGYGLTLIAAFMATHFQKFRMWGIIGGTVASALALYSLAQTTQTFQGENNETGVKLFFYTVGNVFAKDHYTLPIMAGLLLLGLTVVYTLSLVIWRDRPMMPLVLALFAMMPLHPILCHWFDNEQRGHMFGYWFGHDMFTPPFVGPDGKFSYDAKVRADMMKDPEKARSIYPEMTRDAVLYGGTDPGRFCPTYMIFDESFIPPEKKMDTDPHYDRRDVYIITQNALADGTYLMYIRAHYNRSAQLKYDLPFFQELCRGATEKELNYRTNLLAKAITPLDHLFGGIGKNIERDRRAGSSHFKEGDFIDLPDLAARLQKHADPLSAWLFDNVSPRTQQLLAAPGQGGGLAGALAKDLNVLLERELLNAERVSKLHDEEDDLQPDVSPRDKARKESIDAELKKIAQQGPLYTSERFAGVKLPDTTVKFIGQNPQSDTRIRLNRLLLEAAYPKDIAVSKGGVYPDREIYIASPDDSQRCFQEYMADAQHRLQSGQLKPGENVQMIDNRVQVSGQVAVMAINGLLTKVMFDANPDHEFYVEESFPLDWMYPYLTPFGVIMKINRQPLEEITDDIVYRDHQFWSKYSERLIGNWITYDTSVKEICDWAEKVYLRHDFRGFKGDLKFVRDDQAQKAFSKLRSSIGGIYSWRINDSAHHANPTEQQRMIKEADFTFRQSFAFCPYSPEAVFRYVQLLVNIGRVPDALLIAKTCLKFDPENGQVAGLVQNLSEATASRITPGHDPIEKLEATYKENPNDFQNALNLAASDYQRGETNKAEAILDGLVNNPKADRGLVVAIAQIYIQMTNYAKLEHVLERLVQVSPEQAEAWYDLAALKAAFNKTTEAVTALTRAFELNDKQGNQPRNLRTEAAGDPRFAAMKSLPEFQKAVAPPAK